MSDDLVAWLRESSSAEWCGPMLNKAAARIEALEAELAALKPANTARDAETRKRALERAELLCDRIRFDEFQKTRPKRTVDRAISEAKQDAAQACSEAIRAMIEREGP